MNEKKLKYLFVLCVPLILILLGYFLGPIFELYGEVRGIEFSPDLMEHRSFNYYSILGYQTSKTNYRYWKSSLDEYLKQEGYITPFVGSSPRWHLVKGFAPGIKGWFGEAKYACKALGCWSGESEQAVHWSKTHPEMAKAVWPKLIVLLQAEKYFAVYGLLGFDLRNLIQFQSVKDFEEQYIRYIEFD